MVCIHQLTASVSTLMLLRRRAGDVMHIQVLGQHIVIIDSMEAAHDLYESRSAIYSSRPNTPMLYEL